jgi:hypothetical protein
LAKSSAPSRDRRMSSRFWRGSPTVVVVSTVPLWVLGATAFYGKCRTVGYVNSPRGFSAKKGGLLALSSLRGLRAKQPRQRVQRAQHGLDEPRRLTAGDVPRGLLVRSEVLPGRGVYR